MFDWMRKPKGYEQDRDRAKVESGNVKLSDDEKKLVTQVESDFENARAVRLSDIDDTGFSVEDNWEDEYYIFKGGGLQWVTSFAFRTKKARKVRPNSEDNFVFNALTIQHANITANVPEVCLTGVGGDDDEISDKLTFMSRFNDERNEFTKTWKKWVYDFIGAGPTIAMVTWDADWMGGRGPKRWVGDVRVERVDKWDMFFDPAITDLETNMQHCSYIIRRPRKKLKTIQDVWPERGKYIQEGMRDDEQDIEEGIDSDQAYVIEYWHRGFPQFVPEKRRKELNEKAMRLEQEGDFYKAQDYYDSAKGQLQGVHVAYVADGVLLEYCPYEYEDGLYPFVFTSRFFDERCQWGFGETRNIKIPQIMHNKADEIEIEAMCKEGLGGGYFQKGAMTPRQLTHMVENSGKGGTWFEVDVVGLMKEREGVKVPASVTNYKEHKQRMIETLSQVTPIQQGMSPGKDVPFATVQDLGARADVRVKQAADKLEDFLRDINSLRVNRFAQFYEEERYYRIKGTDGKTKEGTLQSQELHQEWPRETVNLTQPDPMTGEPMEVPVERMEKYVPEFDIKVTILSEKPTDRNYYTNLAMQLHQMQLLTPEDLLSTLEEGKLPPMDDILEHVYAQNQILDIASQIQELPPELQQAAQQAVQRAIQGIIQQAQLSVDTQPQL